MPPVRAVRTIWIVAGLILGFAVVLAGPAILVWQEYLAYPLNENSFQVEFQSMRYEAGGLVFRYTIHNLTPRVARFQSSLTEVRALQPKDRPSVGFPNVRLPFEVPPHGSHVIEVRLQLPGRSANPSGDLFDEQTRRLLQAPASAASPASPTLPDFSLQDALVDLNGFVVEDEVNGLRLVLPRGW
ncbi:MAG TPA: hypothetical protein VG456_20670 [Candidatus Sulfopaludibacter sp.]|jgi:hypothetical protein|nr:hypothetical protein [Candidatus Sulfopaludibacter sp.]